MKSKHWIISSVLLSFFCFTAVIWLNNYYHKSETLYRDVQIRTYDVFSSWNIYVGTLRGLLLTSTGIENNLQEAKNMREQTLEKIDVLAELLDRLPKEIDEPLASYIKSLKVGISQGLLIEEKGLIFLNQKDLPRVFQEGRMGLHSLNGRDASSMLGPLSSYHYFQLVGDLKGLNVLFDQLFTKRLDSFISSISKSSLKMEDRYLKLRSLFILITFMVVTFTIFQLFRANRALAKIAANTQRELVSTRNYLSEVQDNLANTRFQESLFELVAALSHELNTPLGNCVSLSSHLLEINRTLQDSLKSNTLCEHTFTENMDDNFSALALLIENLEHMKVQIESFKRLSSVNLETEGALVSLQQFLNIDLPKMAMEIAPNLNLSINSSLANEVLIHYTILITVFSQLISNSIAHGDATKIDIAASLNKDELTIIFSDNGRGVEENLLSRLSEPFYTSARGRAHVGLGLSILASLITSKLQGNIEFKPGHPGLTTIIRFKVNLGQGLA